MTTHVTVAGREVWLRSAKAGEVAGFPYGGDKMPHNRYQIYIYNREFGVSVKFMFFTSYADYQAGKELDEGGLINAFYAFLTDAESATMTYMEFCDEFGYDYDATQSKRIYRAVTKSKEKWDKLQLGDIYEFVNAFREAYPDYL
jgi:hypothetical protein